jgi:hypothetical protein
MNLVLKSTLERIVLIDLLKWEVKQLLNILKFLFIDHILEFFRIGNLFFCKMDSVVCDKFRKMLVI